MTSIPNLPWKSPPPSLSPAANQTFPIPVLPTNNKTNLSSVIEKECPSFAIFRKAKTFSLPVLLTSRRMGTNSATCHFSFLRNALCQYGQLPNIHLVHQLLRYLQPHITFLVYFPEDSFEMGDKISHHLLTRHLPCHLRTTHLICYLLKGFLSCHRLKRLLLRFLHHLQTRHHFRHVISNHHISHHPTKSFCNQVNKLLLAKLPTDKNSTANQKKNSPPASLGRNILPTFNKKKNFSAAVPEPQRPSTSPHLKACTSPSHDQIDSHPPSTEKTRPLSPSTGKESSCSLDKENSNDNNKF